MCFLCEQALLEKHQFNPGMSWEYHPFSSRICDSSGLLGLWSRDPIDGEEQYEGSIGTTIGAHSVAAIDERRWLSVCPSAVECLRSLSMIVWENEGLAVVKPWYC